MRLSRSIPVLLALAAICGLPAHGAAEAPPPVRDVPRQHLPRFDVMEFEIEGNSVLPEIAVERAVYPLLGPGRTLDDVELARSALERAYQDAGYRTVAVEIPEQRADEGVIKLRIVENTVGRVRVTGSRYYDQNRILARAAAAAENRVPDFDELQREIQELNRSPGRRVTPILRPGKSPGTTDIDLNVEDKRPLAASLELNNYHSPNTSHSRLNGSLRYDNLWQREHSLSLQFQTSPENTRETRALSATYVVPLRGGDALALYAVSSDSKVAALGSTSVLGRGSITGLRYVRPLASSGAWSHSIVVGIDDKNFKEDLVLPGAAALQTPIRYQPLSVNYSLGIEDGDGRWDLSTGLGMSFRHARVNDAAFDNKRFNAHANYILWKWDLARTQSLGRSFGLFARFDGQIADQPLVSNEQFAGGGVGSVRGYLQSEAMGDDGAHLALELRGPSLAEAGWITELRPYVFYEGANTRLISPLPGQRQRVTLAAAGVGLNLRGAERLLLTFNLGWPLHATSNTPARKVRAQLSSTLEF